MLDFLGEILGHFFIESIPYTLRLIGACIKYPFLHKRKPYKAILEESWNGRIGLLFILLVCYIFVIM